MCHQKLNLKQYASNLQQTISNQGLQLTTQIFEVRETEMVRRYSCNSSCKGICRIFHQKHNWVKSESEQMFEKLNKIWINEKHKCDHCEKVFYRFEELDNHLKTKHSVDQCDIVLESKTDSENHMQDTHYLACNSNAENSNDNFHDSEDLTPKYSCNTCLLSFEIQEELKEHVTKHKGKVIHTSILKKL